MSAVARLRREDDGVSLVELLVAIAITTIVLGMISTLFFAITNITRNALSTRAAVGTASNAMDEIRRVVREADDNPVSGGTTTPAVVAGTASSLTVISYVDTSISTYAPTQVAFSVSSSGYLTEQRTAATQSNGYWVFTGATTTQTLAGPLVTSGTALFGYLDGSGNTLTPGATGLTATQCGNVASVAVTTTVASTVGGASDPVVLADTIGLINLSLTGNG